MILQRDRLIYDAYMNVWIFARNDSCPMNQLAFESLPPGHPGSHPQP